MCFKELKKRILLAAVDAAREGVGPVPAGTFIYNTHVSSADESAISDKAKVSREEVRDILQNIIANKTRNEKLQISNAQKRNTEEHNEQDEKDEQDEPDRQDEQDEPDEQDRQDRQDEQDEPDRQDEQDEPDEPNRQDRQDRQDEPDEKDEQDEKDEKDEKDERLTVDSWSQLSLKEKRKFLREKPVNLLPHIVVRIDVNNLEAGKLLNERALARFGAKGFLEAIQLLAPVAQQVLWPDDLPDKTFFRTYEGMWSLFAIHEKVFVALIDMQRRMADVLSLCFLALVEGNPKAAFQLVKNSSVPGLKSVHWARFNESTMTKVVQYFVSNRLEEESIGGILFLTLLRFAGVEFPDLLCLEDLLKLVEQFFNVRDTDRKLGPLAKLACFLSIHYSMKVNEETWIGSFINETQGLLTVCLSGDLTWMPPMDMFSFDSALVRFPEFQALLDLWKRNI